MDTPMVGDRVRVVFEGKVAEATSGFLHLENGITLAGLNAAAIEILKPSVADLPVGSVVRVGHNFYVRQEGEGDYVWRNPIGNLTPHSSLDGCNWVQLVEADK